MKKIYLAGPEVFLPDSFAVLNQHKEICKRYGYLGLSPFDGEVTTEVGLHRAKKIYLENCKLIREADIVLANCNSFRGALMDDGTAFEIGYAKALGKKIFGYINKREPLPNLVEKVVPTVAHPSGYRMDSQGYLLNEDFGNSINLMLEFSILESGGELVEGSFEDALKRIV
ncbi:MAG TPA: nucleoside 2-deoxyribosyltransferase [Leptospiraceae bacterium]|nr:nucleoside 2-deoxyribosyltransferase [Leptospiraceae bacterium]HMW05755.1 nucleoside 2-deoxyribosyltransferase [Leptospiraceae bacterium]HMX33863.1 nucleoside 2-deoxyribosyltransferase [Leptospiraceae bacterium]HMY33372.1 nucleoside 2-deoxyribosyltransferase [Leptospiraceae bacterium]HMZ65444.1 nucleoside 2-deoxyribosyltransferase [Leptospiraceae bacterium]